MRIIPESPVRIVVAGCGNMSHAWIEYTLARSDCRIVGLVDLNLEDARLTAEKYQMADVISGQDLAAVIRQTHAGLVFNLTIPAAHYAIKMTAFRESCAVMSEKPLAANLAEADEMIAAASRNNLSFSFMQNRRYLRQIRALRQIVAEGAIGIPGYLEQGPLIAIPFQRLVIAGHLHIGEIGDLDDPHFPPLQPACTGWMIRLKLLPVEVHRIGGIRQVTQALQDIDHAGGTPETGAAEGYWPAAGCLFDPFGRFADPDRH